MDSTTIAIIVAVYFLVLSLIGWLTSRKGDNTSFFTANKNAPWYLIAFGMVGTTISGVTFVSVPGKVGINGFSYLQLVFGYILGYIVIAFVLLPLYYKLNLTSIYTYLKGRYGNRAYKTGSLLFLVSRLLGSALRLFLAVNIFQLFIFDGWGVPFEVSVIISVALVMLYSAKGGIKTIIYTDTLQTFFFLAALVLTLVYIGKDLDFSVSDSIGAIKESRFGKVFFWDSNSPDFFWKQILSGAFITIAMTGLDQEMMQKNLSCRSLKDAQKNMLSFTGVLVLANILFLSLGALLYLFSQAHGITLLADPSGKIITDQVYPFLALNYFPPFFGYLFILGLTAAAFGGADSALASLTTALCVDFLNMNENSNSQRDLNRRKLVHYGFALLTIVVIIGAHYLGNRSVIDWLFYTAGYTYGPLLGLFAAGVYSKLRPQDKWIPFICISSPLLTWGFQLIVKALSPGYIFGFEVLLINAIITILLLWIAPKKVNMGLAIA